MKETIIVCVRVADGGMIALDSVERFCHRCGEQVWVSPSGLNLIADKDATPVCMRCVAEQAQGDEVKVMPITDEQIAEAILTVLHERRRN